MQRITYKDRTRLASCLANHQPFINSTDNFRGSPDPWRAQGRLPALYAPPPNIIYTVWSYATPIAWRTPEGWVIPPARYSLTTTRHQNLVRAALAMIELVRKDNP